MTNPVIAKGRTAVITGAAKGIGAAAAKRLSREGMNLCLFDRDEQALQALSNTLETEVRLVAGDVRHPEDIQKLLNITLREFADIALLMNNAGISHPVGPWGDPDDWRIQLEGNLLSVINVQHIFVPAMLSLNKRSAIVNPGPVDVQGAKRAGARDKKLASQAAGHFCRARAPTGSGYFCGCAGVYLRLRLSGKSRMVWNRQRAAGQRSADADASPLYRQRADEPSRRRIAGAFTVAAEALSH